MYASKIYVQGAATTKKDSDRSKEKVVENSFYPPQVKNNRGLRCAALTLSFLFPSVLAHFLAGANIS